MNLVLFVSSSVVSPLISASRTDIVKDETPEEYSIVKCMSLFSSFRGTATQSHD